MSNNAAFKRNFAKVLARVGNKAELVVRKTALELFSGMVMKSAVDTGRFRGNWQCGFGSIITTTGSPEDKSGSGAIGRAGVVLDGFKAGHTIYMTNSMPYARRLEYDAWSKQATAGMVRITVREYSQYLRKVAAQLRNS